MDGFVAPRVGSGPRLRALGRRTLLGAGDERLLAQMRGRDAAASRSAFEALYDRHHAGVLAFCRHMLGSAEDAEDAVQHTFSCAYRALLRDDREIALRAWLYTIARNRCLSQLAARRDQVALDDVEGLLPATHGLVAEVEQRSDLRELLVDMQRLPVDQRAALVLAELEAHSHKEIAEILGVAPAKVKALVFQARESLMIRRQARQADCTQIREQMSVLRGGALRRRELRRHVELCPACEAFEREVQRQRAGMALLLPVVPTFALKNSTLASAFAATTAGTAAGIGSIATGGVLGGIAIGTKTIGTKVLAVLAVAGGAGGGGYVAVTEVENAPRAPAKQQRAAGSAAAAPTPPPAAPAAAVPVGLKEGRMAAPTSDEAAARRAEGRRRAGGPVAARAAARARERARQARGRRAAGSERAERRGGRAGAPGSARAQARRAGAAPPRAAAPARSRAQARREAARSERRAARAGREAAVAGRQDAARRAAARARRDAVKAGRAGAGATGAARGRAAQGARSGERAPAAATAPASP